MGPCSSASLRAAIMTRNAQGSRSGLLHTILFNRALGMVVPRDVDSELLDITYVAVSDPEVEAVLEGRLTSVCAAIERAARPMPNTNTSSSLSSSQLPAAAFSGQSPGAVQVLGAGGTQGATSCGCGDPPAQVVLSFFERRQRAASGWWGPKEERLVWESWVVNIRVVTPDGPPASGPTSSSGVQPGTGTGPSSWQASQQQGTIGQPSAGGQGGGDGQGGSCTGVVGLDDALATITRCVSDRRDHIPPVVSSAALPFSWDVAAAMPAHGPGRPAFSLNNMKRMLLHISPPPMVS